jgi:hypothetical protein
MEERDNHPPALLFFIRRVCVCVWEVRVRRGVCVWLCGRGGVGVEGCRPRPVHSPFRCAARPRCGVRWVRKESERERRVVKKKKHGAQLFSHSFLSSATRPTHSPAQRSLAWPSPLPAMADDPPASTGSAHPEVCVCVCVRGTLLVLAASVGARAPSRMRRKKPVATAAAQRASFQTRDGQLVCEA